MTEDVFVRARLLYESARCCPGSERAGEIVDLLDRAIRDTPERTEAWMLRGDVLAAAGRQREAVLCYFQAISIDPQLARILKEKAVGECNFYELTDAEACFSRAYAIVDDYAAAVRRAEARAFGIPKETSRD